MPTKSLGVMVRRFALPLTVFGALFSVPVGAATFLIDASAPNTVTATASGVASSAYNGGTASSLPYSTNTSTKKTGNQYNIAWYSAAASPYISTRRTYFTNNGVTLGSLQYFAQTYGSMGLAPTPWYNSMVLFYTDQKDNAGLPPQNIPQINFVEVIGDYQVPEFTAASGMGVTIRFGLGAVTPPAPAVPEPATWVMMLSGFGLVGLVLRRRKYRPSVLSAV